MDGRSPSTSAFPRAASNRSVTSVPEAALAEPLACCIHGADRSGLGQGDSVALIGAGPIGLMLLQTLRNRGAAPIAVSEARPRPARTRRRDERRRRDRSRRT